MREIDPFYHPVESGRKLEKMTSSELHRLLTDYRWVNTIFTDISGNARRRIKALQSILHKRGVEISGKTVPEPNSLNRPLEGGGCTDHALVRYLERVKGIDMRAVEEEMLERVKNAESYFGGGVRVDSEGVSYIMREDGLVKSVMPQEWVQESEGIAAAEAFKIKRKRPVEPIMP